MAKEITSESGSPQLLREPGVFAAIIMGLGSILGTGIFVSIGVAAGVAGPAVVIGIGLAALVAICNGLSNAQLAAAHPRSGGAYEYGYKYLNAHLGFTAGWTFLCAKSALAATAALGISGYMLSAFGISHEDWRVGLGLLIVLLFTALVMRGTRLSNATTFTMVSVTLFALLIFIFAGLPVLQQQGWHNFEPFFLPASTGVSPLRSVLHAATLMFVAYTGYGRIAGLGEEMRNPERTIPRAIVITLLITMLLYLAVGIVAIGVTGAGEFADITLATSAPLEVVAATFGLPGAGLIVTIGAMTAMLGILFNLFQSLSRVMLTMGRRKDMPAPVARVAKTTHTPEKAVMAVGILVALLVFIGDIRTIWAFSAFTVLVYYAITNLAALQLPAEKRRFPRVISALGLLSCLFLAFWVDPAIWITGLILIIVGHGWRWLMHRI